MITKEIVTFCSVECDRQNSGPLSVGWMVDAWYYAQGRHLPIDWVDVLVLGEKVEPDKNQGGVRQTPVTFGPCSVVGWETIPSALRRLLDFQNDATPAEWYREFEEIHPFLDGNGRVGKVLFNWLNGTLDTPVFPPDFWNG